MLKKGNIMNVIFVLIIGAVIIFAIAYAYSKFEGYEIFPGFEKENESNDDIVVDDKFEIKLEDSWEVVFKIYDKDNNDLSYNCNEKEGWKYFNPEVKKLRESGQASLSDWNLVTSTIHYKIFGELKQKNKDFIISLQGKTCEEGLDLAAMRVNENDRGRTWYGLKKNAELKIFVGDKTQIYQAGHDYLKDTRFLIKKINKMTENEN